MTSAGTTGPLVSILVNNYNYAQYLPIAIDSAIAQRYPAVEIIVIDDESTDDSESVLSRYEDRVRIIRQPNGGQPSACHTALRASSGDIVMFLDADDFLYPDAASKVVQAWQPGCAKVQFRLALVDPDDVAFGTDPPWTVPLPNGDVTEELRTTGSYPTPVTSGNAYPRELLLRVFPAPEEYTAVDHYLNMIIPLHGPVISIDEELGAYRQHDRNAWSFSGGVNLQRLRHRVRADILHETQLRRAAAERGIDVPADLMTRRPDHVLHRLASLRLDPATHPQPADTRFGLLRKGLRATLHSTDTSLVDRVVMAVVLIAVAVLPRRPCAAVVTWAVGGGRRPEWMRRIARLLRGARGRPGQPTPAVSTPDAQHRDAPRDQSTKEATP